MRQLWLVVTFLVVMLLIGYGWQGGPGTAGGADSLESETTAASTAAARP